MIIRSVDLKDKEQWLVLWQGYLSFYEEKLSDEITESVWSRLFQDNSSIFGHVAEHNGKVIGFSNCVLHEATWTDKQVCYLEDLYVDDSVRGMGAGRSLIQNLLDMAKDKNWDRVYWHTHGDNKNARILYDRFAQEGGFVRYCVYTDPA